jgi:uncharacterized damage-inducible protein DinB
MLPRLRTLLSYERDATVRVAESLNSVPGEARSRPEYAKALGVFGHVQQATYLWLSRVGGIGPRPFAMFPEWAVEQTVADAAMVHEAWGRFLEGLAEADLARVVAYTSTEGVGYQSTLGEIVTHVFNHATYHRGQIALLVTALGGQRATTDFIAFTRVKA